MSQPMPKGVRRSQLQLSSKQTRKGSTDDEKLKTVTIDLVKTENGNHQKKENGSSKEKDNGTASKEGTEHNVKSNEKSAPAASTAKDAHNGAKKDDKIVDSSAKSDASKKDAPKKDDSKDTVVAAPTAVRESPRQTPKKDDVKESVAAPSAAAVRESPRNTPKRDDSKESVTPSAVGKSPRQKAKDAKDDLDKSTKSNDLSNIVTPDTPDLTPSKDSPKTSSNKSPKVSVEIPSISSAGKDGTNGSVIVTTPEMPSLILESEIEDSPMPGKKPTGKILKLKQGAPSSSSSRSRVSPFRRYADKQQQQQNDSTTVNLSTVSESGECVNAPATLPTTPLYEDKKFGTSLRTISGRKSMREVRDINFYNSRDTYRKLDDSLNSSMNVTVGSVCAYDNDSLFSVSGRKRGAGTIDDDSAMNVSAESPKRARLDFSGFITVLASPVTALRAKFSRAQIKCSTPNEAKQLESNEIITNLNDGECNADATTKDTVSSGIETESIDLAMDIGDVDVVSCAVGDTIENDVAINVESKIEEGVDVLDDDNDDEPPIEVKEIKKNRCNIM